MRYLALIGLFLLVSMRGLAQPGAFGGSLRFRLFDPEGRQIGPGRAGYQCFPSWDSLVLPGYMRGHPERWQFAHTFAYGRDGYWRYQSIPTPAGGILPPDFTILVVHGPDTMRVQGFAGVTYEPGLQIDSIPFLAGRLTDASNPMLNVRGGAGHLANVGWEWQHNREYHPARLTAERLTSFVNSADSLPRLVPLPCSRLQVRYSAATNESAVYLRPAQGGAPQLLLRRLPGRVEASCSGRTLLLAGGYVLKSDDDGTTWHLYQARDATHWQQGAEQAYSGDFRPQQVWLDGPRVLATGYRSFSYQGWGRQLPGTFELHLTPDTTAPAVQRSYAKARADITVAIAHRTQQLQAIFYQNLRASRRTPEHQAALRQFSLQHCTLSSFGASPAPPLLTLQNGHFQYDGTHWVRSPDALGDRVPLYQARGTYVLTDSTITFRPAVGSPATHAPDADFYPVGTYYYAFQPAILGKWFFMLNKWEADRDQSIFIYLEPKALSARKHPPQ